MFEDKTAIDEPFQKKSDSFFGDRSVVMTKKQLKIIKSNPIMGDLYLSDIGFYPHAKNHYRKRKKKLNEHILIYCITGMGTVQIEDRLYHLTPCSYFVIPANMPHEYWSSMQSPWSIYWLHFGGKRSLHFEEFFGQTIQISQSFKSRTNDRINLFNELLSALESGFSIENITYANLSLNSLLASFFYVETYRSVKGFQSTDPVDQTIAYMQKNLNRNLKIRDMSLHVSLSDSHLSKLFRTKTGASPLDYFINLKMQEAVRLLTNQSLRIKEVAFTLGYKDPYYFTRLFTKHFGSSPLSFLKMSRR